MSIRITALFILFFVVASAGEATLTTTTATTTATAEQRAAILALLQARAPGVHLELVIDPTLAAESFRVEAISTANANAKSWRIAGGDTRGLLYGGGSLVWRRAAGIDPAGSGTPAKPVRGVYLATHFGNWFQAAPVAEVETYVDDLALRGANSIAVWFDTHQYRGWTDPAVAPMITRLRSILGRARSLGLETTLTCLANEAWADSPPELRATWSSGHDGYIADPIGHFHVELCPSKPAGRELLLQWRREVIEAFATPGLDRLLIWPYDQGGCTCTACAPWGAKGFLGLAEEIAGIYHRGTPTGKATFSTWCFGRFHPGEWPAFRQALTTRPAPWIHDLLVDDITLADPGHALNSGAPAGLPLIGFPEVTMWGNDWRIPWGSFGATPYAGHLRSIWREHGAKLDGGFIYTEGVFADLNTRLLLRQWWDGNEAAGGVADDLAAEFGAAASPLLTEAVVLLERSHGRDRRTSDGAAVPEPDQPMDPARLRFVIRDQPAALQAEALLAKAEVLVAPAIRQGWRWRCLRLRGRIDAALIASGGAIDTTVDQLLVELTGLYHGQTASWPVAPPTQAAIAKPGAL